MEALCRILKFRMNCLKLFNPYSALHGTGGKWVGSPQSVVHMAAARLSCKRAMVGTRWANSHPRYMNRLPLTPCRG